ncbi:ammonium transporter [Flavobacterium gawalongense]|uniref:Ammonium transporter n=1 Tax=Flavobacterium gawalongense TaxID=2594432 RepID=A0A553BB17_9FLAO|nr:ammonium transporter [Flavobacterium gawalongense]TRX00625.1 ammonium transporter [Flavobacterium gawalongense]TRX01969.1 ammonium transporter [Flavobacterium gawalongense]TRX05446.1 ammonium transporter [Flavobacterium gawalongense]TRX06271.1 ammonium transporter [Flavobacterium gawalongense]TRX21952.1 ammonium transporter [Flavobacterium gawalongense]
MKIEKRWVISFIIISIVCITGVFWPAVTETDAVLSQFGTTDQIVPADVAWMLTSCCLVLIMTPGLSFFYGGMVGKKNVISTMLQSFVCLGVVTLLWVVVGFSLAFGEPLGINIGSGFYSFVGDPTSFTFMDYVGVLPHEKIASTVPFMLFALFQMKFAVIAPAIITGSFAERVRFISYLLFICLFTLFIYAPLCHSVWYPTGILGSYFGVKDFAGGTVVHMSAGFAALAGVIVLGKRKNSRHVPTNIPFVLLGTGMLWFGWIGFNAGSSLEANGVAAMAFATTTTASAAAMLAWIFFDRINGRKVSSLGACIGAVVGLVSITPAAGYVSVPESMFFGFIAALVSNWVVNAKFLKGIDDTLDVFACHGVGGIMGMILTAIFAHGENASLLHGGWEVFGHHMMALVLVSIYTFFGAYILFKITNRIIPMRVSEEAEIMGLDLSQHDETLFPIECADLVLEE